MVRWMMVTWLKRQMGYINAVYTQVLMIKLNRIRSSICTLGNYKQVIGETYIDQ